jgi:hypothetical protein
MHLLHFHQSLVLQLTFLSPVFWLPAQSVYLRPNIVKIHQLVQQQFRKSIKTYFFFFFCFAFWGGVGCPANVANMESPFECAASVWAMGTSSSSLLAPTIIASTGVRVVLLSVNNRRFSLSKTPSQN